MSGGDGDVEDLEGTARNVVFSYPKLQASWRPALGGGEPFFIHLPYSCKSRLAPLRWSALEEGLCWQCKY